MQCTKTQLIQRSFKARHASRDGSCRPLAVGDVPRAFACHKQKAASARPLAPRSLPSSSYYSPGRAACAACSLRHSAALNRAPTAERLPLQGLDSALGAGHCAGLAISGDILAGRGVAAAGVLALGTWHGRGQ